MSFVRAKTIKGHSYLYEQASFRVGGQVVSKHIRYIGKHGGKSTGNMLESNISNQLGTTKKLSEERQKEIDLITKHKREIFKDKDKKHAIKAITRLAERGHDTKTKFFDKTINDYPADRKRLHDNIINNLVNDSGAIAINGKPEIIFLGGPPGSGKSEVVLRKIPDYESKYVVIDNDYIKSKLPGYSGVNAALYHEEASDIYDKVLERARKERKNIILDATLKNTEKAIKQVQDLKNSGYITKLYATNILPEVNVERATARFLKKGRYVPIEYIVQNTPKINKSVIAVAKYADEYKIYDTSIQGRENAKVIAEG
jgi:predicted ABC-type ATPase